MSVNFTLSVNESPKNKIGKTLGGTPKSFDCLLKDDTSIIDPVLIIETADSLAGYNYMYSSDFGRYYFINNIECIGYNLWRISAHVDVLETYKDAIKANTAILERQTNFYNTYISDPEWPTYAYKNVVCFDFDKGTGSNDFENGANCTYVLTVAGGA